MANKQLHRTLETQSRSVDDEDEEVEELEREVKQMAQSILHYRTTLPDRLNKTFDSLLVAQRPLLPSLQSQQMTESGIGGDQNPDEGDKDELSKGALLAAEDPEMAEKIRLLQIRISSNISAIPTILKRMKETVSRIDKLDLQKGSIHPAFKRKRAC